MKVFRLVVYGCLLFACQSLRGQVGSVIFSRTQYKAGSQNWAFQQDTSGTIYIANNEGLLTFNGTKWQLHPLPNHTIVRSIAFGNDGRLYTGGQDEMGFFEPDPSGRLVYHSLLGEIEAKYRQFADVWKVVPFGEDIFFQTSSAVFRLHQNVMTSFPSSSKWDFLGTDEKILIAHDKGKGLLVFQNDKWETLISGNRLPRDLSVTSSVPFRNKTLLTTTSSGLLMLSGNSLDPFFISANVQPARQHYTSALPIHNSEMLLGTYDNGVFHIDSSGNLLQSLTIEDGLAGNNIKCVFSDRQKQIWLGLEDGISMVDLESPIKWLNPKIFNGAPGYAATVAGDKAYFALANGLYEMPLSDLLRFRNTGNEMKKRGDGLTWKVAMVDGRIMVGRDDGFFELKGNQLSPIDQSTGYWIFKSIGTSTGNRVYAAGNYLGVTFFREANGNLIKERSLTSQSTSARFLEYDSAQQAVWISHPYRGVYKIDLYGNAVRHYTEDDGLPSTLNNHIFKIDNQVLVATISGVYVYHPPSDAFQQSPEYNDIFKGLSLRYLRKDTEGNIWFVSDKNLGVVHGTHRTLYFFPELNRKILSGFEHIFPLDKNHIIIGGEQGFFMLNYAKYLNRKTAPAVFIRTIAGKEAKDSVLFGGFGDNLLNGKNNVELSHHWREFNFEFSSPFSLQSGNLEYSYRLKGIDDDWSAWSAKTEKDYAHLPPGSYVFEVKVRNNLNEESPITSHSFEILSPWYKTIWAWAIYALLFALLIYSMFRRQEKIMEIRHSKRLQKERIHFEEKQKLLAYEHQLAIEQSENELMQLRNEKLESELASSAMNLVQKKEFLLKIREEINKLNKVENQNMEPLELKKILKEITAEDRLDEEWDQFSIHFNKVHNNFLVTLKNQFPQLSAHDLKLCAYLRMNLSSKEMARLMSISTRGVEINRYRLRKKLQLQAKENLFEFLMNVESGSNADSSPAEETTKS